MAQRSHSLLLNIKLILFADPCDRTVSDTIDTDTISKLCKAPNLAQVYWLGLKPEKLTKNLPDRFGIHHKNFEPIIQNISYC